MKPVMTLLRWNDADESISIRQESQTPNDSGGLDVELQGEVTLPAEEWISTVVSILEMLPGKTNADRSEFLLGPVGVDPDMVGAFIASRIREWRETFAH